MSAALSEPALAGVAGVIAGLRAEIAVRDRQIEALLAIAFVSDEMCTKFHIQRIWFRALVRLVVASPGDVTRDELGAAMYPAAYRPATLQGVDVVIYRLRRALRPHGVSIETAHGVGYRLPEASLGALRAAGWRLIEVQR